MPMARGGKMMQTVLAFLCLYFLMLAYYFFTQRSFLYYPDVTRPDPVQSGVPEMEVVSARTADGLDLQAWYAPPREAGRPVVVLFHGNGGHIGWRGGKARLFMEAGYGVMLAEYRGYGGNPGKPSEQGFYADAHAWMEMMAARGVAAGDIVLYGESIGSGPAVRMAADYPGVRALVLETPFTSLAETAQHHMKWLPVRFMMWDRFDNMHLIGGLGMPVLILHGRRDMIVPYAQGVRLYEAAGGRKFMETYDAGGHNDLYAFGAGERVLRFLDEVAP